MKGSDQDFGGRSGVPGTYEVRLSAEESCNKPNKAGLVKTLEDKVIICI